MKYRRKKNKFRNLLVNQSTVERIHIPIKVHPRGMFFYILLLSTPFRAVNSKFIASGSWLVYTWVRVVVGWGKVDRDRPLLVSLEGELDHHRSWPRGAISIRVVAPLHLN